MCYHNTRQMRRSHGIGNPEHHITVLVTTSGKKHQSFAVQTRRLHTTPPSLQNENKACKKWWRHYWSLAENGAALGKTNSAKTKKEKAHISKNREVKWLLQYWTQRVVTNMELLMMLCYTEKNNKHRISGTFGQGHAVNLRDTWMDTYISCLVTCTKYRIDEHHSVPLPSAWVSHYLSVNRDVCYISYHTRHQCHASMQWYKIPLSHSGKKNTMLKQSGLLTKISEMMCAAVLSRFPQQKQLHSSSNSCTVH